MSSASRQHTQSPRARRMPVLRACATPRLGVRITSSRKCSSSGVPKPHHLTSFSTWSGLGLGLELGLGLGLTLTLNLTL